MNEAGILVVDDNRNVLTALELLLCRHFRSVKCLSDPGQIPSEIRSATYSAVLLDMNFGAGRKTGNEGLYWLRELRIMDPDLSVVMITAFGEVDLAVTALKDGAVDFVLKPWDNQKLVATLSTAVKLAASNRQVKKLEQDKENLKSALLGRPVELIGRSKALKEVLKTVSKVANTPVNVLITGENGTGKELIAKEIHRNSDRSGEIMVTVDLGAVPENLFESELFGHTRGAFTDAREDRAGKIEAANGGTLFFDEIGNISLPIQAKLLHVLETRSVTRLGSTEELPLDIRLICATNRDLNQMVEEEQFRLDLLYRINTIEIELPPLRHRGEDIGVLANYFLALFSDRYNKPGLTLDDSAKKILKQWKWPGNVRELRHSMERAVILADSGRITDADFQFGNLTGGSAASFEGSLDEVESRLIRYTLKKYEGNMSAVAAQLGISRQTLYNKIRKYGI